MQGVGFRPMIYQLAKEMQLNGCVKNGSDGVHILFNADEETANIFFGKIKKQAPRKSKIISSHLHKTENKSFDEFSIIVEEVNQQGKKVLLTPDIALCNECRKELHDVNNRRYRYPFITCTQCGPRYSIIENLPYERHCTSMQKFKMCDACNKEYNNVSDKRFFSQTNSCNDCGIQLSLHDSASSVISNNTEEVLSLIKKLFK